MIFENCWQMNSSYILWCVYIYIDWKPSRQQRQHADVACVEAAYGDRFEPALSLITWSNSLVTERHLCFCNTTTSTQQRERIQSSCMGQSTTASSRLLINDCIIIVLERPQGCEWGDISTQPASRIFTGPAPGPAFRSMVPIIKKPSHKQDV